MSLIQNGKHVNLVINELPWYTNTAYISPEDLSSLNKSYPDDSNQSIHNSFTENKKVESNTKLQDLNNNNTGIKNNQNTTNTSASSASPSTILEHMTTDKPISNKYLPYTLLYLLIFLAVLLLIYKLGIGSINDHVDIN